MSAFDGNLLGRVVELRTQIEESSKSDWIYVQIIKFIAEPRKGKCSIRCEAQVLSGFKINRRLELEYHYLSTSGLEWISCSEPVRSSRWIDQEELTDPRLVKVAKHPLFVTSHLLSLIHQYRRLLVLPAWFIEGLVS
jgi:hypothetical protein